MTIELSCIICQDTVTTSWTYTNCGCQSGVYHIYCLRLWLEKTHNCPTCRREYNRESSNTEDQEEQTTINITLERAIFLDSIGRYRMF